MKTYRRVPSWNTTLWCSGAGQIMTAIRAREHRVFSGRIDLRRLSLTERAVVNAVRAPHGDFREWMDIRDWAADIAVALHPTDDARHHVR